jgi:OmpA-OmpF porin, OOP family
MKISTKKTAASARRYLRVNKKFRLAELISLFPSHPIIFVTFKPNTLMKKIAATLLSLTLFLANLSAQSDKPIRKQSLGFSAIINDFATAQRIRTSTLSSVLKDKQFAKSEGFSYGFAVNYIKGLTPHVDLAATMGATFSTEPNFVGRENAGESTLLEVDASGHFKMFPDNVIFNPYLIAGVGVSKYTNVYGAILPLGGGFKLNILEDAELHVQLQYRIPITPEANNYHFQFGFGISGLF